MAATSSGEEKKKIKKIKPHVEPDVDPEFQIAPMIDILLVLLVFFMSISTTEVLKAAPNIKLPIAKDAKEPTPGQQTIVNVSFVPMTGAMGIEVDNIKYTPATLGAMLAAAVKEKPLLKVIIRADKFVRFEYMRTILTEIGAAGVANITFAVADKEGQSE